MAETKRFLLPFLHMTNNKFVTLFEPCCVLYLHHFYSTVIIWSGMYLCFAVLCIARTLCPWPYCLTNRCCEVACPWDQLTSLERYVFLKWWRIAPYLRALLLSFDTNTLLRLVYQWFLLIRLWIFLSLEWMRWMKHEFCVTMHRHTRALIDLQWDSFNERRGQFNRLTTELAVVDGFYRWLLSRQLFPKRAIIPGHHWRCGQATGRNDSYHYA